MGKKTKQTLEQYFKTRPTISIGSRLELHPDPYILAQVEYNAVVAVNLKSGNRWGEIIKVKDCSSITQSELEVVLNCRSYDHLSSWTVVTTVKPTV